LLFNGFSANGDGISNHHLESTYPVSGSTWLLEALLDSTPSTINHQPSTINHQPSTISIQDINTDSVIPLACCVLINIRLPKKNQ